MTCASRWRSCWGTGAAGEVLVQPFAPTSFASCLLSASGFWPLRPTVLDPEDASKTPVPHRLGEPLTGGVVCAGLVHRGGTARQDVSGG
jgi:hypothetical protein